MKTAPVLYVDTREQKYREIVARIARYEGFEVHEVALEIGDYATKHAVCERKTAQDLLQSSKQGRLFQQLGKGLTTDKEYMLLVVGTCEPKEAVAGLIASVLARYPGYRVLHEADPVFGCWAMVKWMKKVEQGAVDRPHRLPGAVLVAKLFGVSLHTAEDLMRNYVGLEGVVEALQKRPQRLKQVYGIGDKKLVEMQERVKRWRLVY